MPLRQRMSHESQAQAFEAETTLSNHNNWELSDEILDHVRQRVTKLQIDLCSFFPSIDNSGE